MYARSCSKTAARKRWIGPSASMFAPDLTPPPPAVTAHQYLFLNRFNTPRLSVALFLHRPL